MGSKTSKVAKAVAKSQQRAISPRERIEKMPSLSTGSPTLRHNNGSLGDGSGVEGVDMKEADKFRNDWFPNAHWEQYPVRGDIQEMAEEKKAFAPIYPVPDPAIPSLAEEKDNRGLIDELTFIGKGLTPGPDKSTQFPRLHRDEGKMPKARVSLPEKKLKGFLDCHQFKELYDISGNYSMEELSIKFETREQQLQDIFKYTSWIEQPQTSQLQDSKSDIATRESNMKKREIHELQVAALHKPNQGGRSPFERGTGQVEDADNKNRRSPGTRFEPGKLGQRPPAGPGAK